MVYLGGIVAILVILFTLLMMLGVVPFDKLVVGGLILALAIGVGGPVVVRDRVA
jgi:hypothetical protein